MEPQYRPVELAGDDLFAPSVAPTVTEYPPAADAPTYIRLEDILRDQSLPPR